MHQNTKLQKQVILNIKKAND